VAWQSDSDSLNVWRYTYLAALSDVSQAWMAFITELVPYTARILKQQKDTGRYKTITPCSTFKISRLPSHPTATLPFYTTDTFSFKLYKVNVVFSHKINGKSEK
jgi:hypothetical protein